MSLTIRNPEVRAAYEAAQDICDRLSELRTILIFEPDDSAGLHGWLQGVQARRSEYHSVFGRVLQDLAVSRGSDYRIGDIDEASIYAVFILLEKILIGPPGLEYAITHHDGHPELLEYTIGLLRPLDTPKVSVDLAREYVAADRAIGQPIGNGTGTNPGQSQPKVSGLELIDGGFAYEGTPHNLVGKPLEMLQILLKSRYHRAGVNTLRREMKVDDEHVDFPEQVIKDTATNLRSALSKAIKQAGKSCKDPLPSHGRGEQLTYRLELPEKL